MYTRKSKRIVSLIAVIVTLFLYYFYLYDIIDLLDVGEAAGKTLENKEVYAMKDVVNAIAILAARFVIVVAPVLVLSLAALIKKKCSL